MRRGILAALTATTIALAACAGDGQPPQPPDDGATSPSNTEPAVPGSVAWRIDDVQYVAWDAEHQRVITKHNGEPPARHEREPKLRVTLESTDPHTGKAAWETTEVFEVNYAEVDYIPVPAFPGQRSGARIGHLALTGGGSRGASSHPSDAWLTLPSPVIDLHTGSFTQHWLQRGDATPGPEELAWPCKPEPYGDIALCSPYQHEALRDLVVFDDELRVTQRHEGKLRSFGVTQAGDHLFAGASFDYAAGLGGDVPPESFQVFFIHRQDHTLHEVEVPGAWHPDPQDAGSWGEFAQELTIVPLDGAVLWNNGMDTQWAVITPDGVGETFTAPEGVHFVAPEPGGALATPSEFLEHWRAWEEQGFAPIEDEGATNRFMTTGAVPLLLELGDETLSWSAMGEAPTGSTPYVGRFREGELPRIVVGPNNLWLALDDTVVGVDDGRIREDLRDMTFLEHTDGLDIFSTTGPGFNAPFAEMGSVVALHNPSE